MARISTYPLDSGIVTTDKLLGSDENDLSTKNFSIGALATYFSGPLGYTSLVQLLTQTSTNAPVATEVYNNTGQTYTWSYVSDGVYRITSTGTPFTVNKTVVFVNHGNANTMITSTIMWQRVSDTVLEIIPDGDGRIVSGSFEVKIYS